MQQVTYTYAGAGMDGHTDPQKTPVTVTMGLGNNTAHEEVLEHKHASEKPSQALPNKKGMDVMRAAG